MENPELPGALLRWVKSFEFAASITSVKDLQDGVVFWKILEQVDPDYFGGNLPETTKALSADNWIPRWQNLKHIDRTVTGFICDECHKLQEVSRKMTPDLKAIAIDGSREDTVQLLKLILLAALYSPVSNQRMVMTMSKLADNAASHIAGMISLLENYDRQLAEENQINGGSDAESVMSPERSNTPSIPHIQRDPELEREERLIKAHAIIKERERKIASLTEEVRDKAAQITHVQEELSQARHTLEQGGLSGANNEILAQLRERSLQDKDYIAELESEVSEHKEASEDVQKQLARLKAESDSKQKLRDELQMLKVERDDLLQKSKASENLKKKIQTLQEADKSNATLRGDLESAQEEVRASKQYKHQCVVLQKRTEELMKTISNAEQEIFDRKTFLKRVEHEHKVLTQRQEAAKDRQARDGETISDLEERLRQIEDSHGRGGSATDNLDDELTTREEAHTELRFRLATLEAENARLKEDSSVVADDEAARQKCDLLQKRCGSLEQKYLEAYQENLGLDASLKNGQETMTDSPPFVDLRRRLHTETSKLTEAEKRLFEAEGELADTKVKLESSEAKVAAIDEDRAAALETFQRSATTSTDILEAEKERLAIHGKSVGFQLDELKSLLRHSLLNRDALLMEDDELRSSDEYRLISHELAEARKSPADSDEGFALSLAQRIEDCRKKVTVVENVAAQQRAGLEAQITTSQTRLKRIEEEGVKDAKGPIQENLQRELALMSSAWYDITSRMQSDAVVVQRRGEAPRSFLNKQRRLLSNPVVANRR